jgi:protease-4
MKHELREGGSSMKVKRWQLVFGVVIALILVLSLVGCGGVRGKIAVIPLNGSVVGVSQQGLLTSGGITPRLVRNYLREAEADGFVKAVVLRIESPGGSAAAAQEIAAEIRRFREDTGKPVVVSMGDVAASGGYYISVYADRIVANPATLTGSIGVISQLIYIEGLLEKLGLEMETIKAGEHKDMGTRPLTDEERQIMQAITDDLYEQFVSAVAEGRNLSPATVRKLATGQPYTGGQALELGLVDELGDQDRAIELAAELAGVTAPTVEEYGVGGFWWGGLLQQLKLNLWPLGGDELAFLRMLEGWQAMPRY